MMARSELDGVLMSIQIGSISLIQSHGDGLLFQACLGWYESGRKCLLLTAFCKPDKSKVTKW